MTVSSELDDARDALDRSAESIQVWDSEILLRAVAWVAILQGLLGGLAATLTFRRGEELTGAAVAIPVVAFAAVYPRLRSRGMRTILILACLVFCVYVADQVGMDAPYDGWGDNRVEVAPVIACLLYSAGGALLLRRSRLGRDALLALAGAWVVSLAPDVVKTLSRSSTSVPRDLRSHFLMWALLLPPLFVCATLASQAGRSVFAKPQPTQALAPLTSLRYERGSARAWAAALTVPLACLVTIYFLHDIGSVLRSLW